MNHENSISQMGEKRWRMRRDCVRLMAGVIIVAFLECLLSLTAPTVASLLLGDMADALLHVDVPAIQAGFPAFLGAIVVTVLVAPGITLVKNLLLTRQGTAYDVFLMESALHMSHKGLHTVSSGDFLHRMEVDRTLYYLSVVRLVALPPAVVLYGVFLVWRMGAAACSVWFFLCVLVLSGGTVVYDTWVAQRQAKWSQQASQYEGERMQLELELLSLRDFSRGFGLHAFLIQRLRRLFESYWKQTGQEQSRKTAMGSVLQFLCGYGVQVLCLLAGAILVAGGQMTVGGILGGYLLIPTVRQGWETIKQVMVEFKQEEKFGARMVYFYQDREPEACGASPQAVQELVLEDVSFSYHPQEEPVLAHLNLTVTAQENVQLAGGNGCGKSTLAALLSGVYAPVDGEIVDGKGRVLSLQQLRRSVALQEQDGVIFSGTVWENLFLPLSQKAAAAQLLDELAFSKSLEYRVEGDGKNLSPGERKKLLLTRALLQDTPFLLLDEPLNHLDAQGRAALVRRLRERAQGIILISHDEGMQEHLPMRVVSL